MRRRRAGASQPAAGPVVSDALRARFRELSSGQRRVAEFVLANPADAAFLSAAALGGRVGVSESTVVRLASSAGYAGYPELQQRLRDELKLRLSPQARLASTLQDSRAADVYQQAFSQDLANIVRARESLPRDLLQVVVDRLRAARTNYAVGMRRTLPVAQTYAFLVNQLVRNARLVDGAADMLGDQLALIGPRDTLLVISFPRYSRRSLEVLRFAKRRGAFTVVLTDSPVSPPGVEGDLVLPVPCETISFPVSLIAAFSVVNALAAGLAVAEGQRAVRRLAELDAANQELRLVLIQTQASDT